ncbi:nuclear transport factor 2 family protein [uncultured Sphingomonas sp.]|uniref:nuclear transport factor 2 family protein n=1 Tax=uncultured Sphingomonas sp. TaxID=158754 RepID=UPI0025DCC910|nr:nuclear transport factor 2 family protein [uncultured Sphingomonas sp.]
MMTAIAVAAALLATSAPPPADPLTTEISALDAKVFDAYNRCYLPTFSGYFNPKVAFYHDTGGATFERDAMVDGVRKYICGKVKRELIRTTFRVYPIKDYGAIEEGEHRFCDLATGRCEGIAKFVMVWAKQDGAWRITSVLSYGHRAATPPEQRSATDR